MSKLKKLAQTGQSIWLDYIRRSLLENGELQQLIDAGIRGVTSNPTIFDKAISGSADYDQGLKQLVTANPSIEAIYEALVLDDISRAADLFRPVYNATQGLDGYVSLEVSPILAYDTDGTVKEARRLFTTLNRPNVMIKVPATSQGVQAITQLIGAGINVNATLMFSMQHYRAVANAYLTGLEQLHAAGGDVSRVASVASFFISRIDTAVDRDLEEIGNKQLPGKIAIANAQMVYQEFLKVFSGERWEQLVQAGARVQRVLWASTGTKNPAYPDTLYVDALIGNHTVNTLPPATLDAFLDHGKVAVSIDKDLEQARKQLAELRKVGIDLDHITEKLQTDGVDAFALSFRNLMQAIAEKRQRIVK
ncbi:transaldolase [candidate division KSB1 bacterium]|nr:transaldolase [candidate division KSB1 bacterium]